MSAVSHAAQKAAVRPLVVWGAILLALLVGWYLMRSAPEGLQEVVAARGEFVREVSVSGKAIAARTVELGFSQGGRIAGVYASVGSFVGQSAVIATIENGDMRASVSQKEAALEREEANLASLALGTRPEELANSRAALASDINAAYIASDNALRNDIDQFIVNPRSTTPALTLTVTDDTLARTVLNGRAALETLFAEWQAKLPHDVSGRTDLVSLARDAEGRLETFLAFLDDAARALSKSVPNQNVSAATIADYQNDIASARTNVSNALSDVRSQRGALELLEAGTLSQDIQAQQAQIKSARADLESAQALLAKTYITAPFAGIVTRMDAKVGAQATAGSPLVAMIGGAFQIESYVPEIHVASVRVGDEARVTLDAYGAEIFEAVVASIEPGETLRDGVSTYRTLLQFKKNDSRVRSGMTANVVIVAERRLDVLMVLQGMVVRRDGKAYVTVRSGEEETEREVEVGEISSSGNIEVLSGLEEGEIVIAPR